MKMRIGLVAVAMVLAGAVQSARGATGREIIEAAGVKGGLVVHVGCGDGKLTVALRANGRYIVRGLDTDAGNVARARATIAAAGLYGKVSAARFDGRKLPFIDNLANLIVAEDPGELPMAEVMRVLAPHGAAVIAGKKTVKPWPTDIDEWPQYLHGADNNAVAHDAVVGPPRHLQWVGDPLWSRSHMAIATVVSVVSARGRLFTIEDRATVENPFMPGRFALVARDAFNGIVLWRHDFGDWEPVTRYIKDIAVQSQRRLAAIGDRVYCTPGLNAPLAVFDAGTGKVVKTYAGTAKTQEFAHDRGVLYLVIGDRMNAARYNIVKTYSGKGVSLGGSDPKAPFGGTGFRGAYAPETPDKDDPTCDIVAIEADSGKELWRRKAVHHYVGCSLAIRGRHAVFQTSGGMMCLNRQSGKKVWSTDKPIQSGDGTEANTLILTDEAVYAKEGNSLCAYSLADGARKWQAPIANNYEKSADIFLAAGAIWTGGAKQPTSYDPRTGKQITTIRQRMVGPMSHDRCYRNFITDRYYINSKTGGADFLTLDGKKEFPHHWTRGTCGLGVLPCNGLLYAPPYSCQCSIGAMIPGFNAMYSEKGIKSSAQPIPVTQKVQLVKGPAYETIGNRKSEIGNPDDWPAYRHDGTRGGATASKVPAELAPLWKTKLTTVGSAPVVAGGKVFVADIDAHTVYALDAADGSTAWKYVAGGRVDSPPTVHRGLVLFGSRDGWVHCLRAGDGALAWRFKDLPDKMICAFGQLESAWPVCGSVLVERDVAYFAAGRSSFLDGGIVLYALDPQTGQVKHRRQVYGPFSKATGFPAVSNQGFKSDIIVSDGKRLYLRHKAFNMDLTDAETTGRHVFASAGFLDAQPQHRTFWTIGGAFRGKTAVASPSGDILVTNGKEYFEVRGFAVHRHSYFDPRVKGYELYAGTLGAAAAAPQKTPAKGAKKGKRRRAGTPRAAAANAKWRSNIPLTGKAMALAGDVVFIAGVPMRFAPDQTAAKYEASYAGKSGGILWAASAVDGSKLASAKLPAPPCWDALAAAGGKLFLTLKDGTVVCFGKK